MFQCSDTEVKELLSSNYATALAALGGNISDGRIRKNALRLAERQTAGQVGRKAWRSFTQQRSDVKRVQNRGPRFRSLTERTAFERANPQVIPHPDPAQLTKSQLRRAWASCVDAGNVSGLHGSAFVDAHEQWLASELEARLRDLLSAMKQVGADRSAIEAAERECRSRFEEFANEERSLRRELYGFN